VGYRIREGLSKQRRQSAPWGICRIVRSARRWDECGSVSQPWMCRSLAV